MGALPRSHSPKAPKAWAKWLVIAIAVALAAYLASFIPGFLFGPRVEAFKVTRSNDRETIVGTGLVRSIDSHELKAPITSRVVGLNAALNQQIMRGDLLLQLHPDSLDSPSLPISIFSPIDGHVTLIPVAEDQLITEGDILMKVAETTQKEVVFEVEKALSDRLKKNMRVNLIADDEPSQPFNGIITDRKLNEYTMSLSIRGNDWPVFLTEDMSVSIEIETGKTGRSIVIPARAIVFIEGKPAVWHLVDNTVRSREILIERQSGQHVAVAKGIRTGDVIVMPAAEPFEQGKAVRAALKSTKE